MKKILTFLLIGILALTLLTCCTPDDRYHEHDIQIHSEKAPTCTEIGWDAYVTCSLCEYTTYKEKAALGHSIENHSAKAPTCTESFCKSSYLYRNRLGYLRGLLTL